MGDSTRRLVDPQVLSVLDAFPPMRMDLGGLPALRAMSEQVLTAMPRPALPVTVVEIAVSSANDAPDVRALLLTPEGIAPGAPAILHLHGGAYIIGHPEMNVPDLMTTAHDLGCVVLSVDYRLSPEAPFPAAIEDCYAALGWLHREATRLGIDPARIAVMGESAGGGLAAALALLARDRGKHALAFQLLDAPMIDDRTCLAAPHPVAGKFVFRPESNRFGWACLLGEEPGGEGVSCYAAAARATDLSGLPPAFIATGALDLFLEENLEYARRLARAGVPVELHVYPGCPHGFAMARDATVAKAAARDKLDALRRIFDRHDPDPNMASGA